MVVFVASAPADGIRVAFHPVRLRVADVGWVHVRGVGDGATIEGSVAGHSLSFFPYAGGQAALVPVDMETKPGRYRWTVAVIEPDRDPRTVRGTLRIDGHRFPVQRLTLPKGMVDLDAETEKRADREQERLKTLYRTITPERFWRGAFVPPLRTGRSGSGFGSRRIINGEPRMPHAGTDFPAPLGTPVVAANTGRVALVGDYFFPGRLVVIDHGLGLYTFYFHLASVSVAADDRVDRGQPIGTVGATGRATGPHLHFGAQLGTARIDPAALFRLGFRD